MSCVWTADTFQLARGERIDLFAQYRDDDGNPIELEDIAVTIFDASHAVLQAATVTVASAEFGLIRILVEQAGALLLPTGRRSWLRLQLVWTLWPGPPNEITPKLWIGIS